MKTQANLNEIFDFVRHHGLRSWLIRALTTAFEEARKHKLKTFNEHSFDVNWFENITKLADEIIEQTYQPSPSISFIVFDPMVREIFAAPFVDRVVHHFLYELQGGWWDHRFIEDSYSCREGKGTLYGIQRIQKMMRKATKNFTEEAYVIKLDIKGYFMSLPREKLVERVVWGLDQQFKPYFKETEAAVQVYEVCKFLWTRVLMDDPASKSRRRGPRYHWNYLPPEKSLYTQFPGLGIVIGNLTSQLVSNIFLDKFDRFVKFDLGYEFYGRYVDDFMIIVPADKLEQAKKDVKKMRNFLKGEMDLTVHPKKFYCQSVYKGIPFLGARIYPHCFYPSNRIQKKFADVLHKIKVGDEISNETIVSYFGFFKNLNGEKFARKMFEKYDLDYKFFEEFLHPGENPRSSIEIIEDLRADAAKRREKRDKSSEKDGDSPSEQGGDSPKQI